MDMADSRVKDGNFYVVQSFMVKQLMLKGLEKDIYAIIYGFSQAEGQVFNGSLQYLSDWTNTSKQGVIKALKKLIEKGLIGKKDVFLNGVKFVEYYTTEFNTTKQNDKEVCNKVDGGIQLSCMGGMQHSLPNNISLNNIDNNINKKKESKKEKQSSYNEIISKMVVNENVKATLAEFIKMRKLSKKPLTDFALTKLINKLNKLSPAPSKQVEILERSIINNWQDIYELKEDKPKQTTSGFADVAENIRNNNEAITDIDYDDINF